MMTDDDLKRDSSSHAPLHEGVGRRGEAGHHAGRDVVDMGHRPHLQANAALSSRPAVIETPAIEQPVAHVKPPSLSEGGTAVEGSTLSEEELDRLSGDIIMALKTVHDPEIPADIYELGLIYKIDIADDRMVTVDMTLTAPGCPVAGEMPGWVENAVQSVPGVQGCAVNLVFDPPWDKERMSEEAKLAVGMY
jgi:FeS assembly SUF system protein